MIRSVLFLNLLIGLIASNVRADLATYDAVDKGYYLSSGFHNASVLRTFVGWDAPSQFNSFFVFDLSTVAGTVASASLRLEIERYFGPNPSESFELFPVKTSINALTAGQSVGPNGVAIFGDLANGTLLGSGTVTPNQLGTAINVELTPFAISAINAARGEQFAIGAQLTDIDTGLSGQGVSFSTNSGAGLNRLVLEIVPEPATATILGALLAGISLRRRCG